MQQQAPNTASSPGGASEAIACVPVPVMPAASPAARATSAPRQDHAAHRQPPVALAPDNLTAVGLVLALIAALTLAANAVSPPTPEPAPAPALLGAGASAISGTAASREATRRLETAIGRQLNIGHSFVPWGADLGELPAANLAAGRTPMISFGRDSKPREVASGRHDYLAALARDVAALGQPVLLRYAWGMDAAGRRTTRSGSTFVAAWRHVHQLFAARGVRAFWVWSPNADAFAGAAGPTSTGRVTTTSTGSGPTASTGVTAPSSRRGATSA